MKCRVCGKTLKIKEYRKHICEHCMEFVPKCLQNGIQKMDEMDAKRLLSKFHLRDTFQDFNHRNMWIRYNDVGLTTKGIVIEKKFVIFYEDIDTYFFDFLPRELHSPGMCKGEFCFVFRLKGFSYEFRTLAARRLAEYKIIDGIIYPSFHKDILDMVLFIQKGIRSKSHDLTEEKEKYEENVRRARDAEFERAREEERRKYEYKKQKEEQQRRSDENKSKRTYDDQQTKRNNGSGDELKNALLYFHMEMPYTNEELKKTYRSLIIQCHPDQKVVRNDLKPEDVNRYYGVLKRYVS